MSTTKITYRLETWNPITKRYDTAWEGKDPTRAAIQCSKPYISGPKRIVLITVTRDVLYSRDKNNRVIIREPM